MGQMQYKFNKNDEYYTPVYAVYPILKYIKPNSVIWCPFDTAESAYAKIFTEHGHKVIYGHISTGQDFFTTECPECDYIISNPPYSKRTEVIEKLYEHGKPFAMLINLQGVFDSKRRFSRFASNRVEMIWLHPRIEYIAEGTYKNGAPFQSGYLCSKICKEQINFEYVDRTERATNER